MTELLSEHGKISSTRVAMLLVLGVALFNITWCNIQGTSLPALSFEWVALVAAGLGAKVWQKAYEKPNEAK